MTYHFVRPGIFLLIVTKAFAKVTSDQGMESNDGIFMFLHRISKADPMEKKFTHEELKVSKGKPPEVDPVSWIQLFEICHVFFF